MALVILLRGVNVGGHKTFRPTALVQQLAHLDAVNIGAAGTFVIRRPIAQARLRDEVARRLPFGAEVIICKGQDIARLIARDPFAGQPTRGDVVPFVSILARKPRLTPATPFDLPPSGPWLMKILGREGRFVLGVYRRQMRAVGHLGTLDKLFGVPVTTRNWNTFMTIAKVLGDRAPGGAKTRRT